jgi:hypothetical protein
MEKNSIMTDTDKLEIKEIIHEALNPLYEKIELLSVQQSSMMQSLFGVGGTNGMNGEIKVFRRDIELLKTFRTQVIAIFATVQMAFIVLFQILVFWVKSKFNG